MKMCGRGMAYWGYAWNTHGIQCGTCMEYPWNTSGMGMRYHPNTKSMYEVNISGTFVEYDLTYGICMGTVWNMYEICIELCMEYTSAYLRHT